MQARLSTVQTSSRWLVRNPTSPISSLVNCRLLVFPHAGGSGNVYFPFCKQFNYSEVEVLVVQYPGRGARFTEPACTSVKQLVEELLSDKAFVAEYINSKPYCILGHSMGSVVAFALCCELRKRNIKLPFHFWASSRAAPHIPIQIKKSEYDEAKAVETLVKFGGTPAEILQDKAMLGMILPILKKDWAMNEGCICGDEAPFDFSLTALRASDDDTEASEANLQSWKQHTTAQFRYHQFVGNHMYILGTSTMLEVIPVLYKELSESYSNLSPSEVQEEEGLDTIFSKIIRREAPATIVYEDEQCIAFNDIHPIAPVHVLIVPKEKIRQLSSASDKHEQLLGHLMLVANRVAKQLKLYTGFRIVINNGPDALQSVDHLHLHLLGGCRMGWDVA